MPTPSPAATPPAARWRSRTSLRGMMLLVLLVALPLGWSARRAATQRRAVATILPLGGSVTYEDQLDPRGRPRLPHRPGGPAWLRRWIGDEFFQEVAWVTFDARHGGRVVDDASIAVLNDFDHLRGLTVWGTQPPSGSPPACVVTAAGLARLDDLPRLRALHLYDIGVDAAMMALLPRWSGLEEVTVRDQAKTLPGSSLGHLGQLPRLKRLWINSIASSREADLAPLTALKDLEQVTIVHSPTGDGGVGRFSRAPGLQALTLPDAELTEATLAALARAPNLAGLSFDGSRLPRGGLRALAGASRLGDLRVLLDGQADTPNAHHLIHRVAGRFGDADLDALGTLPLTGLTLMGMDATDAGAGRLLAKHAFRTLTLGGRAITDATAPAVVGQASLTTLILVDTGLSDDGLARLAALPALRTLSLVTNAGLTDAGVARLSTFPRLDYLTICQPGIKPATLDALRAARVGSGPFNLFADPPEAAR